jgi:hypothetical protein
MIANVQCSMLSVHITMTPREAEFLYALLGNDNVTLSGMASSLLRQAKPGSGYDGIREFDASEADHTFELWRALETTIKRLKMPQEG